MKNAILILLVTSLFSCQKNETLDISDLNFSDLNRESIFKNHIKKTIIIAGHDSWLYETNDTIEIREYDVNGNIKEVWRKSILYSEVEKYQYDSLNLETQKLYFTDYKAFFNFRYEFDSDSLILTKYYVEPTMDISEEELLKPAGIFRFNENGLISESFQYENKDEGKSKKIFTSYKYNSLKFLESKKIKYGLAQTNDSLWKWQGLTTYYYSQQKIDSTKTIYNWLDIENPQPSFSTKTTYNENGLIVEKIVMDSLKTYYKHLK